MRKLGFAPDMRVHHANAPEHFANAPEHFATLVGDLPAARPRRPVNDESTPGAGKRAEADEVGGRGSAA